MGPGVDLVGEGRGGGNERGGMKEGRDPTPV